MRRNASSATALLPPSRGSSPSLRLACARHPAECVRAGRSPPCHRRTSAPWRKGNCTARTSHSRRSPARKPVPHRDNFAPLLHHEKSHMNADTSDSRIPSPQNCPAEVPQVCSTSHRNLSQRRSINETRWSIPGRLQHPRGDTDTGCLEIPFNNRWSHNCKSFRIKRIRGPRTRHCRLRKRPCLRHRIVRLGVLMSD